jgi:hypothetical protein
LDPQFPKLRIHHNEADVGAFDDKPVTVLRPEFLMILGSFKIAPLDGSNNAVSAAAPTVSLI